MFRVKDGYETSFHNERTSQMRPAVSFWVYKTQAPSSGKEFWHPVNIGESSGVELTQVFLLTSSDLCLGHPQIHDQGHCDEHVHLRQAPNGMILKLVITDDPAVYPLDPAPLAVQPPPLLAVPGNRCENTAIL